MKIGFFGCGNMGRAIAEGIRKNDSSVELYFFAPGQTRALELSQQLKGHHVKAAMDMPADLDWYVLAFKPQSLPDFDFNFSAEAKILSLLAGTGINQLAGRFKAKVIARLMPNTPSGVGAGANLLFVEGGKSGALVDLLSPLGRIFIMESEAQLDALTAFSGSGPALVFEFARIFEKSLTALYPHAKSQEIIAQTFLGSAMLMSEAIKKGVSFEELRNQVTSKKGVTAEALQVLERSDLEATMTCAFNAAYARTLEIKQGKL